MEVVDRTKLWRKDENYSSLGNAEKADVKRAVRAKKRSGPWFWLAEWDYVLDHLWDSKYGIIIGLLESLFKKYFLSACFALDTLLVTGERDRNKFMFTRKL